MQTAAHPPFRVMPTGDERWLIRETGFSQDREHDLESIFTVSNGRFGVRGSIAEGSPLSHPATYAAGFFRSDGAHGRQAVTLPNVALLRATADGLPFSLSTGRILQHERVLDLRQGLLWRRWVHETSDGRIAFILGVRGASITDPSLLFQGCYLECHNFTGDLLVEAGIERLPLDGATRMDVFEDREQGIAGVSLFYSPPGKSAGLAESAKIVGAAGAIAPSEFIESEGGFHRRWKLTARVGDALRFERLTTVSVTGAGQAPAREAAPAAAAAAARGFDDALARHAEEWARRWSRADIQIEGDDDAQRKLRFAIYHLLSAAPVDEGVSIGARALTGEGYRGHVFWDTEIFVLPFYLLVDPGAARRLLTFRWNGLDAARRRAHDLGYAGALFPWEAADRHTDETPEYFVSPTGEIVPIFSGRQEHHISAGVAWAVWRYWQATHDVDFLLTAGCEILFETARFWASRGRFEPDGRYHIAGVMGPDEYHSNVTDDAYTNHMARWNLARAAEAAEWLAGQNLARARDLYRRCRLSTGVVAEWRAKARQMADGFLPGNLLLEQFRGYSKIAGGVTVGSAPPPPLTGRKETDPWIKQAAVVLLFQLLPRDYSDDVVAANLAYYAPRTAHASSLSPSTYALVAGRLGERALARRFFMQAADIDLSSRAGNASGGVHIAGMGGLCQATLFGFAGLQTEDGGLSFRPHLPEGWSGLRFQVQWQQRRVAVQIRENGNLLDAELVEGEDISVSLAGGPTVRLGSQAGRRRELRPFAQESPMRPA